MSIYCTSRWCFEGISHHCQHIRQSIRQGEQNSTRTTSLVFLISKSRPIFANRPRKFFLSSCFSFSVTIKMHYSVGYVVCIVYAD